MNEVSSFGVLLMSRRPLCRATITIITLSGDCKKDVCWLDNGRVLHRSHGAIVVTNFREVGIWGGLIDVHAKISGAPPASARF